MQLLFSELGAILKYLEEFSWTAEAYLTYIEPNMWRYIIAIATAFCPFWILLPWCFRKCRKYRYVILYSFLLSFAIELIQGITLM